MVYDEKILALLERMDLRLEHLEADVSDLKTGQAKLETDASEIKEDVSELRAEMNDRFDGVEFKIDEAWKDLSHLEDRVDFHDTAIKNIM